MLSYSSKQQYEEVYSHTKGIIIIIMMMIMSLASIMHIYVSIHNNFNIAIDSYEQEYIITIII